MSTLSLDGREIELVPGGKDVPVTWSNRLMNAELLESYKMSEFSPQLNALLAGMSSILPPNLFYILTWEELELMVCGQPDIDVQLLKNNSELRGFSETDPIITQFWEVSFLLFFINIVWNIN